MKRIPRDVLQIVPEKREQELNTAEAEKPEGADPITGDEIDLLDILGMIEE